MISKKIFFSSMAVYLAVIIFASAIAPKDVLAYAVASEEISISREVDMDRIQRILEEKILMDRLKEFGLTADEINSRLAKLSDSELHQFAADVENLYPGGSAIGVIIGVLIIAVLVIVMLQLTGHKVIVEKSGK